MKIQFRVQENPLKTLHLFFVCGKKYFAIFFFDSQFGQKKHTFAEMLHLLFTQEKYTYLFMYTSTTFIPWPFSKIFYGNKCSYLISIMTRIYPCSRYTSISTVLWERKNHAIYSVFREINFAKFSWNWFHGKNHQEVEYV